MKISTTVAFVIRKLRIVQVTGLFLVLLERSTVVMSAGWSQIIDRTLKKRGFSCLRAALSSSNPSQWQNAGSRNHALPRTPMCAFTPRHSRKLCNVADRTCSLHSTGAVNRDWAFSPRRLSSAMPAVLCQIDRKWCRVRSPQVQPSLWASSIAVSVAPRHRHVSSSALRSSGNKPESTVDGEDTESTKASEASESQRDVSRKQIVIRMPEITEVSKFVFVRRSTHQLKIFAEHYPQVNLSSALFFVRAPLLFLVSRLASYRRKSLAR